MGAPNPFQFLKHSLKVGSKMEVRINTEGEIIINITNGDGQAAFDLIDSLQNRAKRKKETSVRSELMRDANTKVAVPRPEGSEDVTGELNRIQYRTWEFLCENDSPDGVHVSRVAQAFGLTRAAANTRLVVLTNTGYAKRVHRGYYRAETPSNG